MSHQIPPPGSLQLLQTYTHDPFQISMWENKLKNTILFSVHSYVQLSCCIKYNLDKFNAVFGCAMPPSLGRDFLEIYFFNLLVYFLREVILFDLKCQMIFRVYLQ